MLLGWIGFLPMMLLNSHVTSSCIFHAYVLSFLSYSELVSLSVLSLSLSLSLCQTNCAMAPKERKSTPAWNLLQGARSSSSHPPVPLHIWFCDEKARTDFFKNFQFNWNVRLFCRTLPTLFYSKSFGLGVGNFYVRDLRGVPSCLFKSISLAYTALIPLCLSLLLYSKVHVS